MDIFKSIITNVLTSFYQTFWFSVVLTVFASFFYLYAFNPLDTGHGIKDAFVAWSKELKNSSHFRRVCLLIFYTVLILFKTLLYRGLWLNPVQNVMGGWWIWKVSSSTGEIELTTECFENILMMAPFTFLLLLAERNRVLKKGNIGEILWLG